MWTIFKPFIEFVTIFLLFYVLVFGSRGMGDLNSPTKPTPPALEGSILTTGPPGKFPSPFFLLKLSENTSNAAIMKHSHLKTLKHLRSRLQGTAVKPLFNLIQRVWKIFWNPSMGFCLQICLQTNHIFHLLVVDNRGDKGRREWSVHLTSCQGRTSVLRINVCCKHPDDFAWSPTRCENCREDEFLTWP